MKKLFAVIIALLVFVMPATATGNADQIVITDALEREVIIEDLQRVGIASGSLAECWMLAGGDVCAVTQDAKERNLELPVDVIDLGSLKEPSLETILTSDLDLVMLMPTLKTHLAIAETLDKAGIIYAYFDVENFDDYLELLRLFTQITGRQDLYEQNGASILPRISAALERGRLEEPAKILILRTSSGKIKALDSSSMTGGMLKEFDCINIADSDTGFLTDLSLEAIYQENPDYIFISCMGDVEEGMALLNSTLAANPIWNKLKAVQNNRCFYLEKELFHHKPNARWGESYEKLADMLTQD